jgi:hypothetical protein
LIPIKIIADGKAGSNRRDAEHAEAEVGIVPLCPPRLRDKEFGPALTLE